MFGRGDYRLFGLLFVNFLLYGGVTTLVGATLPLVIREFSWSYFSAGVVIASGAIGYFTTTFLAGLIVVRSGPQRLITLGLASQAVGIGCFGAQPHVGFSVMALVLVGIGQGATEIATNYSVIQMEPSGTSRLMNLMHAAFTIGAVATPALAAFVIDLSGRWRPIYLVMAGLTLLVMVLLRTRSLPFALPRHDNKRASSSLGALTGQPLLWLLTLMFFLYVGAEMGISAWISEFYVTTFEVSPAVGAMTVSTFWLGILLGRVLTSLLYRGTHPARALVGFGATAAICLFVALVSGHSRVAAVMFFATGVGFSAIYPLGMTLTGQALSRQQGMAIGVVSTGGGLGACCFPFLMSAIADEFGILSGFWFYLGITVAMVLTMLVVLLTLTAANSMMTRPARPV
jgi:FHS family glucose/mannose:H+ symporter-like MFS transporter